MAASIVSIQLLVGGSLESVLWHHFLLCGIHSISTAETLLVKDIMVGNKTDNTKTTEMIRTEEEKQLM